MKVAAAEACGGDVDLDFVGGGRGDGAGFLVAGQSSWCSASCEGCERTTRRSLAAWRTEAWISVAMMLREKLLHLDVLQISSLEKLYVRKKNAHYT